MSKPRYSKEAQKELYEAGAYIAADNPSAAEKWRDEILSACDLIAKSPLMGRERLELAKGVRSFPVGRFIIFYEVRVDAVFILHVLRGAMDVEAVFKK